MSKRMTKKKQESLIREDIRYVGYCQRGHVYVEATEVKGVYYVIPDTRPIHQREFETDLPEAISLLLKALDYPHNGVERAEKNIIEVMESQGYALIKIDSCEDEGPRQAHLWFDLKGACHNLEELHIHIK